MDANVRTVEDLSQEDLARLVLDMFHRIVVHYGLWFAEVRHQMGPEAALDIMDTALERSRSIQLARLGKLLGFEVTDGLPEPLARMPRERLLELLDAVAVNWLANDGVWFQAVEFARGMTDAKRCNDSTWGHFSPFEAWSIKRYLKLPDQAGLAGLRQALQFRLYARVNSQSFIEENPNSLILQMNDCRVQSARKRKGLQDYPCKSGGTVEYNYFARAMDARIQTECLGCPPDDHPEEWYCAWRFFIPE
jgi:hypothetical protein